MPKVVFTNSFISGQWHVGDNDMYDYYERPEAFKPKAASSHSAEYDMYDYMGNTEKSDGIFSADKDLLNSKDIEKFREFEKTSMQEGCPKYIQVLSFQNSFLEENHIMVNGEIDKAKLRNTFRKAMAALIEREPKFDADNCYWVAAIHTNTDNIHIHCSLLEYHRLEDRVKKYKDGDMISVDAMNKLKSVVANDLIEVNERTKEHTAIERELLLPSLKKLFTNTTAQMIALRKELPPERGWQYNRPKMKKYREQIDRVVNNAIESNDELKAMFEKYTKSLDVLTDFYRDLYGEGVTDQYLCYKANKLDEFYARAGNSLLNALKMIKIPTNESDINQASDTQTTTKEDYTEGYGDYIESDGEYIVEYVEDNIFEAAEGGPITTKYVIGYDREYKEGLDYLYGNKVKDISKDLNKAIVLFENSAKKNNPLASLMLGQIYSKDKSDLSALNYKRAFDGISQIIESKSYNNVGYLYYLIARMYQQGQGCERSDEKSAEYYIRAAQQGVPYAIYAAAECYDKGRGIERNADKANELYNNALLSFEKKCQSDDSDFPSAELQYKIGCMYLKGKGCEIDEDKAIEWLEKSIKNKNDSAEYVLGRLYLRNFTENDSKSARGLELLERQSQKGNADAQYLLGKRYLSERKTSYAGLSYLRKAADEHDHEQAQLALGKYYIENKRLRYAEQYLQKAAQKDNSFAYYQLGRLYNLRSRPDKAMECFHKSSELGNEFAREYLNRYTQRQAERQQRSKRIYRKRHSSVKYQMRSAAAALNHLYSQAEAHLKQLQSEYEYEFEQQLYEENNSRNFD